MLGLVNYSHIYYHGVVFGTGFAVYGNRAGKREAASLARGSSLIERRLGLRFE
jgi:hypothetical protein